MASNKNGLTDEDGDHSDWIEIHNPDATAVSLLNWSLTDKESNPRKWAFPDVTIPADGYLIVYASDKDRRVAGLPLHTNFALSADGEYLALVKPDGATKTTEFAPAFPPQYQDISYGVSTSDETVTLLQRGSPARGYADLDNTLGTTWIAPGFDDSAWKSGTFGVGYFNADGQTSNPDLSSQLGLNLLARAGNQASIFVRAEFQIPDPAKVHSLHLRLLYDDGFIGYVNGQSAASGNAPMSADANTLANGNHPPTSYEDFDLTARISDLVAGRNVLALHALNTNAPSSDLFLLPELTAVMETDAEPVTGYFSRATPGERNGGPSSIQLPQTISFSRASGPFTTTFSLTLSGAISGQQIRYVIADPSASPGAALPDPTITSTLYSGPITIFSSKLIRAAVFDPVTGSKGRTATAHYPQLETGTINNTSNFTSTIPLLVADDHGFGQPVDSGSGAYTTSMFYLFEPVNGTARLTATPTVTSRAGIRVRGSSSATFPKKSFALETRDESDDDAKMPLFDLAKDSDWVLNGPWQFDDAYSRNAVAYELSRDVGRWAPRTRFVEMFANWGGGKLDYSDYVGLYVLTEKIKSASGRLDITGIGPSDVSGDALTGGYIFKTDRADSNEVAWVTDTDMPIAASSGDQRLVIVEPDPDKDTSEQIDYLKSYIQRFDTTLYNENAAGFTTHNYRRYIDVDSWVDHHILNSLMNNVDALRLSAFFHKDRGERIQAGPLWDFDRSAGSDDSRSTAYSEWGDQSYFFTYGWWGRLFQDPDFVQAWVDRWFELRAGPLSAANIGAVVDGYGNQIGNTVGARDAAKWPNNAPDGGAYLNEVTKLKTWLANRATWLDTQAPNPPMASLDSGIVTAGATVTLSGSDGAIRYKTDGTDPRPAGGGATSDASSGSGPITINQTTILRARRQSTFSPFPFATSIRWSAPLERIYLVNEAFAAASDLAVSEISYHPASPTAAELAAVPELSANDFQFVEIRNVGSRMVNLFEVVFQNPATPLRAIKLDARTLAPGDYALIVKRRDAFTVRYGVDAAAKIVAEWSVGSLPDKGELTLAARGGEALAAADYDDAAAPASGSLNLARNGSWQADAPSPGASGPTFAQWQAYHFPAGGANSVAAADPDADAATNAEEYARVTDPQSPDNAADFASTFASATLDGHPGYALTYRRPDNRPGAHYDPQESTDLVTWTAAVDELVSTTTNGEIRRIPIRVDPAAPGGHFYRVRITVDP